MSDHEHDTPRSRRESRQEDRDRPKKKSKGKGKAKREKTPDVKREFLERDEFSNVIIKCSDKTFYMNDCLLSYWSDTLRETLKSDGGSGGGGGGKGKGKQSGSTSSGDKELDWSAKKSADVTKLLEIIDPRVPCELTDEYALCVAPLAKEFQMKSLLASCERTLTNSYYEKRKARRLNMDMIIAFLECSDPNQFQDLNRMCIETLVRTNNPYVNNCVTRSQKLTPDTKICILQKKLEWWHLRNSRAGSRANTDR